LSLLGYEVNQIWIQRYAVVASDRNAAKQWTCGSLKKNKPALNFIRPKSKLTQTFALKALIIENQ
jgi:hypothetical protein